jgi:very-short-patch-repair endonuclease
MDTDSPSPVSLRETSSPRGGEGKTAADTLSPLPAGERTVLRSKTGEGKSIKPITHRQPHKTAFARKLRENETEEEWFLWSDLKDRRLQGHKFVRQIPLGPYIVDFLCRRHHLIVELDGVQHAQSQYDVDRTVWLNRNSYSVLRFWNGEVRTERTAVLETILAVLEGRIFEACGAIRFSPAHSPSLGPAGNPLPVGERGKKSADPFVFRLRGADVLCSKTGEGESNSHAVSRS